MHVDLDERIVELLNEDFRMPLTEMSRRINVPVSTLFDRMSKLRKKVRVSIEVVE